MATKTTTPPDRLLWSIQESAEQLGISRNFLRQQIALGELTTVRLGRRVFISARDLDAFIKRNRRKA